MRPFRCACRPAIDCCRSFWKAAPCCTAPHLSSCPASCLQGHRGRGIWRCALLEPCLQPPAADAATAAARCFIFTGGADSSIKCWRLADWLPLAAPTPATAALQRCTPAAAAQCFALRGTPPDPATVEAGQVWVPACHPELRPATEAGTLDSKAEWARQLALASSCGPGSGGSGSGTQPWRQRWLYVSTNQGLLHRVRLPGEIKGKDGAGPCCSRLAAVYVSAAFAVC